MRSVSRNARQKTRKLTVCKGAREIILCTKTSQETSEIPKYSNLDFEKLL